MNLHVPQTPEARTEAEMLMGVVDNIAKVDTDENDRPLQEVRIIKAELVH